jgi:AAA+ ATPase superfamily predicted ATPase
MKFVNRHQEMARLNKLARQREGGVAVVWGRRRVGKTRLLLEWAQKHRGVYYTADESAATIQRKYFAMAIEEALPGFSSVDYPDWKTLFSKLANEAIHTKWRGPIVIDELPYLISSSPELPSILQAFVDKEAKRAKLILVLCGSSQHMMQGAILESSAPLYGRADEILKLGPISPFYMKEALKLKNPSEIIANYAIWGGIPRYWELVEKNGGHFTDKIDKLVLDPISPLNEEPNRLLLDEIPPAINLKPILDAIGLGAHRLSEVAARIGQPATSLMRPIQKLIDLDLIQREIPFGSDAVNSKRTLYKIKDPFMRFWFEVVAPRRSMFTQATPSTRIQGVKQSLPGIISAMWEELCRMAVPSLTNKWNRSFGIASRYWQGQNSEWDILALSEDTSHLLIGEAKWTAKAPSPHLIHRLFEELRKKGAPPVKRPSQILYVLFVPEKPKSLTLPDDAKIITAKEVIEALR